jgi:hypothetical protein
MKMMRFPVLLPLMVNPKSTPSIQLLVLPTLARPNPQQQQQQYQLIISITMTRRGYCRHCQHNKDVDSPSASHQHKPSPPPPKPYLVTGQLVWVCKSKGLKQSSKKRRRGGRGSRSSSSNDINKGEKQQQQRLEAFMRARIVHGDNEKKHYDSNSNEEDEKEPGCRPDKVVPHNSGNSSSKNVNVNVKEEDKDEDRLLVRYPKGSTYMVKRNHLWPVLEQPGNTIHNHCGSSGSSSSIHDDDGHVLLVLVFAETNFYRRACMVHTLPDGADIFWEIGCDAGSTIHKVASTLSSSNDDSSLPLRVMGIDKSQESIDEARRLYPHLPFCLWDVLAPDDEKDNANEARNNSSNGKNDGDTVNVRFGSSCLELAILDALSATSTAKPTGTSASSSTTPSPNGENTKQQRQQHQQQQLQTTTLPCPTIVAIDINGNRELPAVLACLQKVSSLWKPRLILVKSRALHGQLSLPPVEQDATLAAMMMKKSAAPSNSCHH